VDHPALAPDALVRPWRLATFVAGTLAALELVALLVIGVAVLAKPVSDHVRKAAEAKVLAPVTAKAKVVKKAPVMPKIGKPKLARSRTSVVVLNGNGRSGAAAAEAQRVRAHGYRIGTVGNAPRSGYGRSVVMYRPGYAAEGKRLGRDLHIRIVSPLDGLGKSALHGAQVVVVVGA
jgi:hypothetical protein